MRSSPSTTWVSRSSARRLSFACAFATPLRTCFSSLGSASISAITDSTSSRAYQTSRLRCEANARIDSR